MSDGLPLFDLFTCLREADLPLGIDEYRTMLRALHLGFGIGSHEELRRVCKILWVKSAEDEYLLDYHLDRLVKESERIHAPPIPDASRSSPVTTSTYDAESTPISHSTQTKPISDTLFGESSAMQEPATAVSANTETQATSSKVNELDKERMQAVQAALHTREIPLKNYILTGEYFPVTRREMKQNWRYLRRLVREGIATELDVDETVRKIGREGMLLSPVLVPRRVNRTELLLLIDQGGSMVPFHALSRHLVDTAIRGGRLGRAGVYYFHNVPVRYVYGNPALLEPHLLKPLLQNLRRDRTVVLIFSDAGAARGNVTLQREAQTKSFLDQLHSSVRRLAWLNPMPRERWEGTTAAEIASLLPMFEFARHGMDQAVDALRGRYAVLTGQ